jgi:hypothetical protein
LQYPIKSPEFFQNLPKSTQKLTSNHPRKSILIKTELLLRIKLHMYDRHTFEQPYKMLCAFSSPGNLFKQLCVNGVKDCRVAIC